MATQFYRKKNPKTGVEDFYDSATNAYISPSQFNGGVGYTEKPTTPIQPTNPALRSINENQDFASLVKEAIQRKQNFNKDTQSAKTYWKSKLANPMTFTDERLQLSSPAQQRALREDAYATARANLAGVEDIEAYRGQRTEDILSEINKAEENRANAEKSKADEEYRKLQILGLKKNLGVNPTASELGVDISSANAKQIANAIKKIESGGDYNIVGDNGTSFGAYQYQDGTWDKYSSEYAKDVLKESTQRLEKTPENQDAVTEWKIQQWLNKGYSPDQIAAAWNWGEGNLGKDYSKAEGHNERLNVDYSVPNYVKRFTNALGENFMAGNSIEHVAWNEKGVNELALLTGKDFNDLWNNYSDSQLNELSTEYNSDYINNIVKKLGAKTPELANIGITNDVTLKYLLELKYNLGASDDDIIGVLPSFGINLKTDEEKKSFIDDFNYILE